MRCWTVGAGTYGCGMSSVGKRWSKAGVVCPSPGPGDHREATHLRVHSHPQNAPGDALGGTRLRAIHLSRLRFVRACRARVVWRGGGPSLSLIHISEPTRQAEISYAVFCLKKK